MLGKNIITTHSINLHEAEGQLTLVPTGQTANREINATGSTSTDLDSAQSIPETKAVPHFLVAFCIPKLDAALTRE